MRRLSALVLTLAALAAWPAPAPAAGPVAAAEAPRAAATIADFAGGWVGRSVPESDRERNATLLIDRFAGDAFRITWTSFEADSDAPGGVARRERTLLFRPSQAPGIWIADPAANPFEALGAWARIDGRTLRIDTLALRPDGKLERQSYDRTLTADGLALVYRRWVDHVLDRQIEAEYLRL